ncbi:hypothetical protein [Bathymodiolus platifrons methanotrophic gill symbiont]|uniref:hypothetical protein n=1 Tax=Bathymodiolus platifrons methanotrophic gill symbiont TaxID=113268 RepID=UPI001C8E2B57|nr:hypothetical protein [Bathymodiolus platifrons methanotrophic gill symbiont]
MGDALNALSPHRLRTKAASSLLPHWLDGYSECNSCSSRVLLAHVESANCSGSRYFCESLFWASQPKQAAKT